MDIVISVVELLYEFTDEDADMDHESDEHERTQEAVKMLIDAFVCSHFYERIYLSNLTQVENSALELLVENLARLNEEEESDRQGVFQILGGLGANCHSCRFIMPRS